MAVVVDCDGEVDLVAVAVKDHVQVNGHDHEDEKCPKETRSVVIFVETERGR